MAKPTISFVGVGRMGANMARHLKLDCGYELQAVFDANTEAASALATELGCLNAGSLREVTSSADVIITVISNDAAMEHIFFDEADNLFMGADGKLFINCATLSPAMHQKVSKAAVSRSAAVLEAAMASSITQAREGSLFLMVAGPEPVFADARPLLEDMSVSLHYTGAAGTAAQVKALVNMVMNINTAGLAEGLGLADALGLDLQMVKSVFSQTGANSRVLETDADDMIAREHDVYFSAEHAAKDSGIALELAEAAGIRLPLAAASKAQYDRMVALGLGELDKSGVAELTFLKRHGKTK